MLDKAIDLATQSDSTFLVLFVVIALIIVAFRPVMKTLASIDRFSDLRHLVFRGVFLPHIRKD